MITVFSICRRAIFLGALIAAAIFCTVPVSQAATLYYWDSNGSSAGAGSQPNGTWGEDAYWNVVREGTGSTVGWTADDHAVFAAGTDATTPYTVTVSGTQFIGDMHFDYGAVTLDGGTLALNDGQRIFSAFEGVTGTINTVLTSKNPGGVTTLIKYKPGTLIFGGANTYSGSTMIEGGIIQLAAADRIPNGSKLILGNGDTRPFPDGYIDTPATFHTGGFSETLGALKLTGPNPTIARTIDFGDGASAVVFADSSAEDWEGIPLTIVNYTSGVDSLRFGNSNTGLTSTQLASIVFVDFGGSSGTIDANGFVTPAGPSITDVTGVGTSNTVITWTAIDSRTYRVQYKGNFNEGFWTDVSPDVFAVGTTASTTDDTSVGDERYYRVVLLP
ncbi:MAG: autotransporter-associated beta strand repeat-containing protein [Verrucomicrobia bacterium]|nr:autotransporter-associated beta strand repeat-containing protein [Verrucomicrobiota bacterium]